MRSADYGRELPLGTYEHFADRDPLTRAVMGRILAGVSTCRFAGVGEPVGSEVEREATATSKSSASEMFAQRTATALRELMSRELEDVRLAAMMLDGSKALAKAIREAFGAHALLQRCQRHKERNVTDLLPESGRDRIRGRMRAAWALADAELARQRLELLASELERTWPDAASSLREGMAETLTLMGLGIDGNLAKTLSSTNPIESMVRTRRHAKGE